METLLLEYGPLGIIIIGLTWWGRSERDERRALQSALTAAQEQHAADVLNITKDAMGSMDAMQNVVERLRDELKRGGQHG